MSFINLFLLNINHYEKNFLLTLFCFISFFAQPQNLVKQIADSSRMAGMFAEYFFDVSNTIKADDTNALAVKIYPLDEAGLPAHPQLDALGDFYANGGSTGDVGKNVTMLCSVGWDWIP